MASRGPNPRLEPLLNWHQVDEDQPHCLSCWENWKDGDKILRHTTCQACWHAECIKIEYSFVPEEQEMTTCGKCRGPVYRKQEFGHARMDWAWQMWWDRWAASRAAGESEEEFLARPGRRAQHDFRINMETARDEIYIGPLREAVRVHDEEITQSKAQLSAETKVHNDTLGEKKRVVWRDRAYDALPPGVGIRLQIREAYRIHDEATKLINQAKRDHETRVLATKAAFEEKSQAIEEAYRTKKNELIQTKITAVLADPESRLWREARLTPKLALLRIRPGEEEVILEGCVDWAFY